MSGETVDANVSGALATTPRKDRSLKALFSLFLQTIKTASRRVFNQIPEGYQDETGFHYGVAPEDKPSGELPGPKGKS